ncbi:condensin-2 complex subunit H2 isoform X2 [Argentina anserina]|uniref:condensin-2 complex subunit H2 isoform X2 n=1 Tax=Argentina anserina TaxID=57926 RepID=UPI002176334C|nr:condensin-2 complex subunit H2 isoform X2 [Potentilla anserina]
MTNARAEPSGGGGGAGGEFHTVQAERDLESNWELDLAKKLEEYLKKICSGEFSVEARADGNGSVNFVEAAMLVYGSVQVYSRKVEYFHSLVLRTLEFLSQKRQNDQSEGTSVQPEEVEAKCFLDNPLGREVTSNLFVKPPSNLVVLEGDCLDTTGDSGELESYLLATCDLYRYFILLDPCDAVAVDDYLGADGVSRGQSSVYRACSTRESFLSPSRRSGGTAHRSQKFQAINQSPLVDSHFEVNGCNIGPDPPGCNTFDDGTHGYDMGDRYSEPGDLDDEDDDPWKPLNPHEPGNLKVKPFQKVKAFMRKGIQSSKQASMAAMFPPAKLHGPISPELMEIWEIRHQAEEQQRGSQSPPLFEKLRQSLIDGTHETFDGSSNPVNDNAESDNDVGGFREPNAVPPQNNEHDDGCPQFGPDEAFGYEDPNPHASLEELCRSHLDTLLASIAENEKQTELAARVSSWKQKIEHNLEEQESHPPFDIQDYGERIIDRISVEPEDRNVLPFSEVVKGQGKYDVARSFSALLQLVNNENVELDRSAVDGGQPVCFTAANPFHVRLLRHDRRRVETGFWVSRKRVRSPLRKACRKVDSNKNETEKSPLVKSSSKISKSIKTSTPTNCKLSAGKNGGTGRSPDAKRRRSSRFVEPLGDLHSPG